jgi:hypothetical protein
MVIPSISNKLLSVSVMSSVLEGWATPHCMMGRETLPLQGDRGDRVERSLRMAIWIK